MLIKKLQYPGKCELLIGTYSLRHTTLDFYKARDV